MVVEWVEEEFRSLDLGHKRREDRVRKFVAQAASIGHSTPDRTRCNADLKGVYRLANNSRVVVDEIFDTHHQAARDRCASKDTVFLVQDTSEFDLTKPKQQVVGAGPSLLPGENQAFSATQATWRFLSNPNVSLLDLVQPLREVGHQAASQSKS
ncbi:IS4/Tn5 family transposase DNA-binding protein, partial [Rhodopirellula bahusiensis]